MGKEVRIACAGIWHTHAKDFANSLKNIPDCKLVGVWDSSPELAAHWAEECGCRCYTDYDAMVASEEIDAVIVTCPTVQHADLIIRAARAGKHVFVEKALTATLAQANAVKAEIEEAQRKYRINFVLSDPVAKGAVQYAKGLMDAGAFGRVLSVRSRSGHDLAFQNPGEICGYQKPEENGGGVLLDMGHHAVHTIHYLLGNPIRANAMFETVSDLSVETGAEDHCIVTYQYAGGAIGIVEGGLVTPRFESGLEVVGTKGYFISSNKFGARFVSTDGTDRIMGEDEFLPEPMKPLNYWIKCIANGLPCELYQVDEAVEIMGMIEMAYQSVTKPVKGRKK